MVRLPSAHWCQTPPLQSQCETPGELFTLFVSAPFHLTGGSSAADTQRLKVLLDQLCFFFFLTETTSELQWSKLNATVVPWIQISNGETFFLIFPSSSCLHVSRREVLAAFPPVRSDFTAPPPSEQPYGREINYHLMTLRGQSGRVTSWKLVIGSLRQCYNSVLAVFNVSGQIVLSPAVTAAARTNTGSDGLLILLLQHGKFLLFFCFFGGATQRQRQVGNWLYLFEKSGYLLLLQVSGEAGGRTMTEFSCLISPSTGQSSEQLQKTIERRPGRGGWKKKIIRMLAHWQRNTLKLPLGCP